MDIEKNIAQGNVTLVLKWLLQKKNLLLYLFAGILALLFISSKAGKFFHKAESAKTLQVKEAIEAWKGNVDDQAAYNRLKALVEKTKTAIYFQGMINQHIIWAKTNIAKSDFMKLKEEFKNNDQFFKYYDAYSDNTIRIAAKEYDKALIAAKSLREMIINDLSVSSNDNLAAGPVLFLYNMMRVAYLEDKLGNHDLAKEALLEVVNYIKRGRESKGAYFKDAIEDLLARFKAKNIELIKYLESRIDQL